MSEPRNTSVYLVQLVPLLLEDIMNILVCLEAKCVGAERHPTKSLP